MSAGKVKITAEDLRVLGANCLRIGTQDRFIDVAVDWARQADAHIRQQDIIIAALHARLAQCDACNGSGELTGFDGEWISRCPACQGNDADAPCAYPSEGKPGCLRDKRLAQPEPDEQTYDGSSGAWFAVAMNAAASLEDAANCLRDPDAKRSALGAAEHVRKKCNEMWKALPRREEEMTAERVARWLEDHDKLEEADMVRALAREG